MSYQQTIAQIITEEITDFTARYCMRDNIATEFGKPLVGFADAMSPEILELPSKVNSEHLLPRDIMPDASVIISYFIPFTRQLARSNSSAEGGTSSPEWARAYEELNSLFEELNNHLVELLPTINCKGNTAG
ncbi:MAG: epoxyqueuosine reductase, partial [Lentihominibacter sp.]